MTLELFLPHGFASDPWWAAFRRLAVTLERPSKEEGVAAYAALARELVAAGHADLSQAIAHGLVTGEPPLAGWFRRQPSSLLSGERELLEHDLTVLCSAARRDLRRETTASVGHELPPLTCLAPVSLAPEVVAMRRALSTEPVTEVLGVYLAGLARNGGGLASINEALRWRRGRLEAVTATDDARHEELVGLDEQLSRLTANTEALLGRRNAHNVLLYGPRGSGKSTAIRGLLSSYGEQGLRLVELPLDQIGNLPDLLDRLRDSPLAFVLFVDDLSFEEGDAGYRPLRTLLEGGLSGRPANVAVYATSNRRHLLKERFRDRPDPLDDDVHRWDTQHEQLALADRFGLTITFPDAGQRRYLELVRELAKRHGIEHEALDETAIRFAEWGNGYSGRTAAQFVASLRQRV